MPASTNRSPSIPRLAARLTGVYVAVWLLCLANWMWIQFDAPVATWLQAVVFAASLPISLGWIRWAMRSARQTTLRACVVSTLAYVLLWQLVVFVLDSVEWNGARKLAADVGTFGLFFVGLAWLIWAIDRAAQRREARRRRNGLTCRSSWQPQRHHESMTFQATGESTIHSIRRRGTTGGGTKS